MTPPTRAGRPLRVLAAALGVFVLLEVVAAAVFCVVVGWSWAEALEAFVVTNAAIGLSFGICGAILAWHRPHNPIGWLPAVSRSPQLRSRHRYFSYCTRRPHPLLCSVW